VPKNEIFILTEAQGGDTVTGILFYLRTNLVLLQTLQKEICWPKSPLNPNGDIWGYEQT
jgi:hypothetical protein